MKLAEQWRDVVGELPPGWAEARLSLEVPDEGQRRRAASLLGPAGPGRAGDSLRFAVSRGGGAIGPDAAGRLLSRLDEETIAGSLRLVGSDASAERAPEEQRELVEDWDAEIARLPEDWNDLYVELRLRSSDDIDRSALALAPVNPSRPPGELALRFRVARVAGYGASPGTARTRLAQLDAKGIRGSVRILRALSEADHVYTNGPVWHIEGRTV